MVPGYREARQLGAGRTGRVHLATYEPTGAYVAVKYLNATLRRDAEFMERFRSDAPRLVELDDPNVVRLYEYVETPERAAVVMELVDGVSLRTLLAEHGRLSPEAALAVVKSTLAALVVAHERGVPHRDVQPGNILVQADGGAKLGDFGVVVHAEAPGVPAGTPAYMAPELWTRHRAGPAADVYAAACVLFESVRGRPPYRAYREGGEQDVPALRERHLTEPVPLEEAPDTLRDLLRRGLAKGPEARYATAAAFARELEEDAVVGYGRDWEQRGRRQLAELATLLALRFPLAGSGGGARAARPRVRVPRLPPQLWMAGAAVVAALVAILLSGGRLPSGPGTILMPPPGAEPGPAATSTPPEPGEPGEPARTTPRTTPPPPPPPPSRSSPPPPSPPPGPTRQGGGLVPGPAVLAVTILRWNGTAGSIAVSVDGAASVRLRVAYTRRNGERGVARRVREESRTLSGRTSYTVGVRHEPGRVACGGRAYAGIVVMTEPAAGNGPQVGEAAVHGPACPEPPAPTPPPDPACPWCGGRDLTFAPVSGEGVVHTYTSPSPPAPGAAAAT
ncbi:serine/threonine-protein kinase [Nonomuraea candida]|uniref:serine/threonine-protein kinase n=1 Tax=Nonomuraea candida TaxID=359159 RepID=UPI00069508B0|nr:serine/threonine-protein kinase [Nonomuraea candida]